MDESIRHELIGALLLVLGFVLGRLSARGRKSPPAPSSFARPSSPAGDDNGPDEARLLACLRAHGLIEAIKLYRQLYGSDLRTAKEAVEALARQHGIRT